MKSEVQVGTCVDLGNWFGAMLKELGDVMTPEGFQKLKEKIQK